MFCLGTFSEILAFFVVSKPFSKGRDTTLSNDSFSFPDALFTIRRSILSSSCHTATEIGASPKTVELVLPSFYVHDFLTSVSSTELLSLYSEVRASLSAGDFYIIKFCNNIVRKVISPGDASSSA